MRESGILLPLSALPSDCGIGTMGEQAYRFIDFLSEAKQSCWQLLPLNPSSCGNSPYSALSSFAGEPIYIDPALLVRDGLLTRSEARRIRGSARVDYAGERRRREKQLRLAYGRMDDSMRAELIRFRQHNARWLDDYTLYVALRRHFGGKVWTDWDDAAIRRREAAALNEYRALLADELDYHAFVQFLFFRQWAALRDYAHAHGVSIIGDIPVYVALDSADAWSEPEFFLLDADGFPTEVAGVPPDYFNAEGQRWGNPLYDWERMRADGFGWWIRRIDGARKLYDRLRIDHFRGFESYWAIPANEPGAKNGVWRKGPGMALVGVLTSWFYGVPFIAEDLGILTPAVHALRRESGLPGMTVLQFAFDAKGDSLYLPHNCEKNSVCYLGTHDNNTILGWLDEAAPEDIEYARQYMHVTEDEGWCRGFLRTGMATPCELFVVQMQELLELPGDCRTNTPGVPEGNWVWRMLPGAITKELTDWLADCTLRYRRAGE